jgi:hypothetical protein
LLNSILAAAALVSAAGANHASASDGNMGSSSLSPIGAYRGLCNGTADISVSASDICPTMFSEAAVLYQFGDQLNLQLGYACHTRDFDTFGITVWQIASAQYASQPGPTTINNTIAWLENANFGS